MKTLVICEKPSQMDMIMRTYPHATKDHLVAGYILPYAVFPFKYPNNLKYSDLPFTREPDYSTRFKYSYEASDGITREYKSIRFFEMDETLRRREEAEIPTETFLSKEKCTEFFTQFDEIIVTNDPDRSGEMVARQLLARGNVSFEDPRLKRMLYHHGFCENSFKKEWFDLHEFNNKYSTEFYNLAIAKHYFDYNFNMMSNLVFGDLLRHLGVDTQGIVFTKYQLMTLHLLRQLEESKSVIRLIELMGRHRGSGKFESKYCDGVGSAASRKQIIDHLHDLGLTEYTSSGNDKGYDSEMISLSSIGERFMDLVHKKTFDPDLPMRLTNWGCEFDSTTLSTIDRYLKTVFGKQIRFQAKHFKS